MRKISVILAVCLALGNSAAVTAADSVDYSGKLSILENLITQCTEKGISVDYEKVNYNVIERFNSYINTDIKNGVNENIISYNISCLDELYTEAKSNLEAYLAGEKEPHQVPKYVTGKMTIDGKSTWAITETGGIEEYRPYFFVGYGHGDRVIKDTPIFSDLNVHTIQIETGPKRVMAATTHFASWSTETSMAPRYEIIRDTDIKYSGDSSLKLIGESGKVSGQFVSLTQSVPVEGGKTYVLKGRVKSSGSGGFFVAMKSRDVSRETSILLTCSVGEITTLLILLISSALSCCFLLNLLMFEHHILQGY